jgi:hypothetical protein
VYIVIASSPEAAIKVAEFHRIRPESRKWKTVEEARVWALDMYPTPLYSKYFIYEILETDDKTFSILKKERINA